VLSLTRKAGTESPKVKESQRYIISEDQVHNKGTLVIATAGFYVPDIFSAVQPSVKAQKQIIKKIKNKNKNR